MCVRVDGDSDASTNMRKQPVTRADQRKQAENSRWETERETARWRKRSLEEGRKTGGESGRLSGITDSHITGERDMIKY